MITAGFSPAFAENDVRALERRLYEIRKNPLFETIFGSKTKPPLSDQQIKLLDRAVDGLSEKELDGYLEAQGLSQSGSVHQKKFRLRQALGTIAPPSLPQPSSPADTEIENASEGEFVRGYDDKQGLLILRGRIKVRTKNGIFFANTVIIDSNRKEIYGEGNVLFQSDTAEIRGERIIIDQRLGTGILYNAEGYNKPVFFVGPSVVRTSEEKYAVSHAHFTTCAADLPHYSFSAKKIWIHEGEKIVAVGVLYKVGGVPLLPLPFLYASDWGTGIVSQIGVGDIQGTYIQNTYQFSVPSAAYSGFLPMAYRIKADAYQNTGEMGGVELIRVSPGLSYFIDLESANYSRYEIISDYRDKDRIRVTDNVRRDDGTYGKDIYKWYKVFGIVNYRGSDLENNTVRNVHIRYEDYAHRLFDYEFGGRNMPESTIPALYKHSEAGRGFLHNSTNWNLIWNEQRDDLSIRVEANRNRTWLEQGNLDDSHYIPVSEVVPSVDISKKTLLGRIPYFDAPFYWDNTVHTDVKREYSGGKPFRSLNENRFITSFRSDFSWYPFIEFQPVVGYGAQRTLPYQNPIDESLDRTAKKRSYEFLFTESSLRLGPDFLFLEGIYRRKDSFREELADEPVVNVTGFNNNQKINETEVTLETNPFYDTSFSVSSIYDHRKFQYEVDEKSRWYYPIFRSDIYIDFINSFRPKRENLLSRQRLHFLGIRLTNDLIYDTVNDRYHSDVFGINFQAGGFDLWLLKRLRYFESGFYWYHVYSNPELDHMRYSSKMDVQLTRTVYFEMELESRATEVEKYSKKTRESTLPAADPQNPQTIIDRYMVQNYDASYQKAYVPFNEDVANGIGINGPGKREEAVFNTGYYQMALLLDLHDWELKIGYEMEQRSMLAGTTSAKVVNFYDNKVYITATLLRFDFNNIASRPSRFIINRRRVRSGDIGNSGISSRIY